jgi:tripartite-type tricarboxylate transporter receptor subunit TctC
MRICAAVIVIASAICGLAGNTRAQQAYPARPITVVVPFAAGGPTDVLARVVGQHMSETLGQQIVVENVTGAGGSIAAARVAKAAPDGYTLVMGNLGTHAASVGLYKNLSYDPRKDFEPVMLVASTPMVMMVRKNLKTDSLKALIAYAQTHKLTCGSAGTGSKGTPHSMVERINGALEAAMRDPAIAKRLAELGADLPAPEQRTPKFLASLVSSEIDKWVPLLQAAGVSAD